MSLLLSMNDLIITLIGLKTVTSNLVMTLNLIVYLLGVILEQVNPLYWIRTQKNFQERTQKTVQGFLFSQLLFQPIQQLRVL